MRFWVQDFDQMLESPIVSRETYTVSGFPQHSTPTRWLNCARVESGILSSTGSLKSLSAEWGAEVHFIGKRRFKLVSSQLSLLRADCRYSVKKQLILMQSLDFN